MTSELNLFLGGLLFSQGLICAALSLLQIPKWEIAVVRAKPAVPVLGFLALAFMANALVPWFATFPVVFPLQIALLFESFLPLGFWLLCETLFQDDFGWQKKHAFGLLALAISLANVCTLSFLKHNPEAAATTSQYLVLVLKGLHLLFIAAGLAAVLKGWRQDVVAVRLVLRFGVLLVSGIALSILILGRFYLVEMRELNFVSLTVLNVFLALLLLGANLFIVKYPELLQVWQPRRVISTQEAELAVSSKPVPTESLSALAVLSSPLENPIAKKLHQAMEVEALYKEDDLTIATLAHRLHLPEYRLRAHINGDLGFRNFNQFLAFYRVEAAKALLSSTTFQHEKIISVALEVGFASLAPFNRSFKELTGQTPSEFRQTALATPDSSILKK